MNENFKDLNQQAVDYKVIFFKLFRYWYLFVLTIFVALIISFLFNKYTKPVYEVKTTVLIKDKSENRLNPQDIIGLKLMNNMQNLQNEIGVLSSFSLSYRTVTKIGFEVAYFSEENLVSLETYKESPFLVVLDTSVLQPFSLRFNLTILSKDQYRLEIKDENVTYYDYSKRKKIEGRKDKIIFDETLSFGKDVINRSFKFRVLLSPEFDPKKDINKKFYFVLKDYEGLVAEFKSFKIEPINKEASIVEITSKGGNVQKLVDFLNQLTQEYLQKDLEKKNLVATKTITFIDSELKGIADSLYVSEKALELFRTNNSVMNLDDESKQVFDKMMTLQDENARLIVQSRYLNNLKEYLEKNKSLDELVVPSSMGVENPLLDQLTIQLTKLYNDKTQMEQFSKEKNPSLRAIDLQINSTKDALYENIKSAIKTTNIASKEINDRMKLFSDKINQLPETQRILFGIERKFKLTDAIYTYLLQKRSEAQITQASNLADNEVVDQARVGGSEEPVFPKKSLNYILGVVLGIVLPIIYIFGKDYLNDKIVTREDVEKLTSLPIIGHIIHSEKHSKVIVAESPKSSIAESFRSVRTNVQYLLQGKEKQVILITSDAVGVGKTYCSINLAAIYALYGKKTLLMGKNGCQAL